ncbi:MAG: AMP-binding protein, partial [Pseudomonadota bacterium]
MLFIDFFDRGVERFPDRPVIIDGDRQWTYREMDGLVTQISQALIHTGMKPGDRVGIFSPNHGYGFAVHYATLRAGGIWFPLNFRNGGEVTRDAVETFNAPYVFFHSSLADDVEPLSADPTRRLICLDADVGFAPSLDEWVAEHAKPAEFPLRRGDDLCALLLTSGTTGKPKGISLTNKAFSAMVAEYDIVFRHDVPPVHLVVAPITHAAGAYAVTLLAHGGTHVLMAKPDTLGVLEAFEKHKVTTVFLPPTLIYMLLAHPKLKDFDYSSLRTMLYGAAPMSVQKLKEAIDAFGPVLTQVYAQSEALMMCTIMTAEEHVEALNDPALEHRLASAGREGPLVRIGIMNDEGALLPTGETGEIVVRGEILMEEYVDNPEATAEAQAFGWHHTGDVGRKDEDGFIYIVDRKKEMIITGGFNVFPSEVERVVLRHPAIQDCAVIGIPDEKWGEAVLAAVELKPEQTVAEEELIEHCKASLGSVKAPKAIQFVEALPRSGNGKVLRRVIR